MVNPSGGRKSKVTAARRDSKRPFYILLAVLLVAGIATIGYQVSKPAAQTVFTMDSTIQLVANQGHVLGSDTALVEVVEFADFECPACGNFATLTEPDVRTRLVNTGQIRYRFMDFPLEGHANTRAAHNAAWCASEQNKFWEMHDAIFQSQDRWSGYATRRPLPVFEGLAQQVGVNVPQYQQCMSSRKFAGHIQSNYDEGLRLGVGSTPTFIIGTKKIANNMSYDEFKKHVDEALAVARAQRSAGTKSAAGTNAPALDVPREAPRRP
ncbi:MAG TPA: thioredoxin domain-containing protein [Gemmatimonadaceae bacterium]|nr:thioredoxin domain-containing protein [Gemmatimonadaceae bacterium]